MKKEEERKPDDKPWYQEPGCLIALALLAGLLLIGQCTYDPDAPDPYEDNPLSDPDLYDDRPSGSPY